MDEWMNESNRLSREAFTERFGSLFECSPWVARRVWSSRPFADKDDMLRKMEEVVHGASAAEQLELLQAHPELGARAVMTAESVAEQRGAGLDRLERDEAYIFAQLNAKYRGKFGFPFIIAVRGLTADMIADSMQKRMSNSPEEEKRKALQEVCKIASFRLRHMSMDKEAAGGSAG